MDTVRLRSGREVLIRPIRPEDAAELRAAYARLSPQSKYRRFMSGKPHLSAAETRYLTQIDGSDHCALVAVTSRGRPAILGVGRYIRLPDQPEVAEFAIVVGDPFQQDGLGTALMERLRMAAAASGITSFKATMLAENLPAHHLVRGFARTPTTDRHLGSVDEIEIDLSA